MLTGWAVPHMTTQRRTATLFDGRHDLKLPQAQVTVLCLPPNRPMVAEDNRMALQLFNAEQL